MRRDILRQSRGVRVADRRLPQQRAVDGARREVGAREAGMALVGRVELEVGPALDALREGDSRRHHLRVVGLARLRVLLGELRRHLRLVLVGPGHEQDRPRAVGADCLRVLLRVLVEDAAQLRVDGALAAVHEHHRVELPARRVELDLVVRHERVLADAIAQVALHVVPVDARAADGHRDAAVLDGLVAAAHEAAHVPVHAVVVVEEAVADPEHRPGRPARRGLRGRLGRGCAAGKSQQDDDRRDHSGHGHIHCFPPGEPAGCRPAASVTQSPACRTRR